MIFSARLDETGTDGRSPYVFVAGAVSRPTEWDKLEASWSRLLATRHVAAFHTKEWDDEEGDFSGWSKLKRDNFSKAQRKIIKKTTIFQFAVGVERKTHTRIKNEWRGVKNFKADSDYGLCFRVARFLVCEKIAELFSSDSKVSFMVESGPYAADAATIYEQVRQTQNAKYRPALYSQMLNGFASVPKGELRSLEAADYLAGRAIADMARGAFPDPGRDQQISMLLTAEYLERWNENMSKERAHRHEHAKKKLVKA